MSKVKSKDSKLEVNFRKALWQAGFRYIKNSPKYFGRPDMVLPRYKTVIFVDSCFWHGCKLHCRLPSTRKKYWMGKINRNIERDKEVNRYYNKIGWKILRIWEHELLEKPAKTMDKIVAFLKEKHRLKRICRQARQSRAIRQRRIRKT